MDNDKNCKNPTSDALDFVKIALVGASENQFHYRSSKKKPTVERCPWPGRWRVLAG